MVEKHNREFGGNDFASGKKGTLVDKKLYYAFSDIFFCFRGFLSLYDIYYANGYEEFWGRC